MPATASHPRHITFPPGARTLGIPARNSLQIIRHIQSGFRFHSLARLQKATNLPWDEIARFTGIPQRTLTRRQKEGRLTPEESDRTWRAAALFDNILDLFEGDLPAARRWLREPQPALAGDTPLHFASTQVGAREVENLIGRLEHGVFT